MAETAVAPWCCARVGRRVAAVQEVGSKGGGRKRAGARGRTRLQPTWGRVRVALKTKTWGGFCGALSWELLVTVASSSGTIGTSLSSASAL